MNICLLTSQDLDADPFPDDDWPCDPRPFYLEAAWDTVQLKKRTAVREVTRLARNGYDLFFNLCDGAADEKTPGIEVVRTLEQLGVPFTGATSEFYEPSRERMKQANLDAKRVEHGLLFRRGATEGVDQEEYAKVAVDHSPDVGRYRTTLGKVYLAQRDMGHAKNELERALELDEGEEDARAALATLRLSGSSE